MMSCPARQIQLKTWRERDTKKKQSYSRYREKKNTSTTTSNNNKCHRVLAWAAVWLTNRFVYLFDPNEDHFSFYTVHLSRFIFDFPFSNPLILYSTPPSILTFIFTICVLSASLIMAYTSSLRISFSVALFYILFCFISSGIFFFPVARSQRGVQEKKYKTFC